MRLKAGPVLLLSGAAICFALALADQLSSGDLYDRGSTLRTDREGASAYFEALSRVRGMVSRNYAPPDGLAAKDSSVLLLEVYASQFGQQDFIDSISGLAKRGGRVVIAMNGFLLKAEKPKDWNIAIHRVVSKDKSDDDEDVPLWPLYFEPSGEWRVMRSVEDRAVAVERPFGAGSIALVASAHPFLNLDLRDDRDLELLEWAVGDRRRIVFDESHLGSRQSGTIMGLMRRLRLQGLLAVLMAASLLFFWQSSAPFPPVPEPADEVGLKLAGGASNEALRNLLERRIPPSQVMAACVHEWSRDFARRVGSAAVKEASEAAAEKASPVEKWEKIRGIARGVKRR